MREFKDSGRYFSVGEWASVPITERPPDWTLLGSFNWLEGDGPLIEDQHGEDWGWLYNRDGVCAYRIGSIERRTRVPTQVVRGRWSLVAVAKAGPEAILWINDGPADVWNEAPATATLSDAALMKHAVGNAANIAYFIRRMSNQELSGLFDAGSDETRPQSHASPPPPPNPRRRSIRSERAPVSESIWFSTATIACLERMEGAIAFWLELESPLAPPPRVQTVLHAPVARRMHRIQISTAFDVTYREATFTRPGREVSVNIGRMAGASRLFVAFSWSSPKLALYVGSDRGLFLSSERS
jgi:hypothetical protein